MNKDNRTFFNSSNTEPSDKNIKGALTRESYVTYSSLCPQKRKRNIPKLILYLTIAILIGCSVFIFASQIKKAFFNEKTDESDASNEALNIVKSSYEDYRSLKVEKVTPDISNIFNIPQGVKIIEIENNSFLSNYLKVGDIIVEISGESIYSLDDMNYILENTPFDNIISLRIYRNGVYKTITPYEE